MARRKQTKGTCAYCGKEMTNFVAGDEDELFGV